MLTTGASPDNSYLLHNFSQFELEVHHRILAYFQIDSRPHFGFEALLFNLYLLRS